MKFFVYSLRSFTKCTRPKSIDFGAARRSKLNGLTGRAVAERNTLWDDLIDDERTTCRFVFTTHKNAYRRRSVRIEHVLSWNDAIWPPMVGWRTVCWVWFLAESNAIRRSYRAVCGDRLERIDPLPSLISALKMFWLKLLPKKSPFNPLRERFEFAGHSRDPGGFNNEKS